MALRWAIVAGAIAGLGIPMATNGLDTSLGDFISSHAVHFRLLGVWLHWSWAIFAAVTLFTWVAFKAVEERR